MPHDKLGRVIAAGDQITLTGTVTSLLGDQEDGPNLRVKTDKGMAPEHDHAGYELALSARMVEKIDKMDPATTAPAFLNETPVTVNGKRGTVVAVKRGIEGDRKRPYVSYDVILDDANPGDLDGEYLEGVESEQVRPITADANPGDPSTPGEVKVLPANATASNGDPAANGQMPDPLTGPNVVHDDISRLVETSTVQTGDKIPVAPGTAAKVTDMQPTANQPEAPATVPPEPEPELPAEDPALAETQERTGDGAHASDL